MKMTVLVSIFFKWCTFPNVDVFTELLISKNKNIIIVIGNAEDTSIRSMGVRGLFSFLHQHDEFFEDTVLRDCKVVIGKQSLSFLDILMLLLLYYPEISRLSYSFSDGNNLRYHLFHKCPNLNSASGGDYKKYYKYVQSFFRRYSFAINPGPLSVIFTALL